MAEQAKSGYSIKIRRRKRRKAKEKEKRKINRILLFVLSLSVAAGIVSKLAVDNSDRLVSVFSSSDIQTTRGPRTYLQGIKVDGVDIGGLTYEQAKELLETSINTSMPGNAVTIKSSDGSKEYKYSYSDFGIQFNVDRALKNAFEYGQVEEEYLSDMRALEKDGANFSVYTYSRPKITSFVRAIGAQNTVEPKNAACTHNGSGFEVQPEVVGYKVDSDKILGQVLALIDGRNFNQTVTFDIETVEPSVKSADFAYIDNELSSFASPYSGGDANRIQNLRNG